MLIHAHQSIQKQELVVKRLELFLAESAKKHNKPYVGRNKIVPPYYFNRNHFTKMKNLTEKIYKELLLRNNVLIVGPADSGKTYYALNELIPFFKEKGLNIAYFPNCNGFLNIPDNTDIIIVDEVETLMDKGFLEQQHPKDKQYYSAEYLEKVKNWHNKLKLVQEPAVFILTRNKKEEIEYLIDNIKTTDWGVPVKCLVFENYKNTVQIKGKIEITKPRLTLSSLSDSFNGCERRDVVEVSSNIKK